MYSGPNPCRRPDFTGSPANGFSPGIKKLKCPLLLTGLSVMGFIF